MNKLIDKIKQWFCFHEYEIMNIDFFLHNPVYITFICRHCKLTRFEEHTRIKNSKLNNIIITRELYDKIIKS